jgi:hypothetical protein
MMSGCLPCICSRILDGGHFLFPDADAGSDWACSYCLKGGTLDQRYWDCFHEQGFRV